MKSERASSLGRRVMGLALVAVWNPWSIAWLISPDGVISSALNRGALFAVQFAVLGVLVFFARRGALPKSRLASMCAVLLIAAGSYGSARGLGWVTTAEEDGVVWDLERVVSNEELHLVLVPRFKLLGRGLMELEVPSLGSRELFAEQVLVRDIAAEEPSREIEHALDLVETSWSLAPEVLVDRADLQLLSPLLDGIAWVEHGTAYLVKTSRMPGQGDVRAESEAGIALVARDRSGRVLQVSGHAHVVWTRAGGSAEGAPVGADWRVAELLFSDLSVISASGTAYEEVLAQVIVDEELLKELRSNGAMDQVRASLLDEEWEPPYEYFQARSSEANEAVSVVDFDGDGHDDLYFLADVGRNILLRNQGDGTFVDATEGSGLECAGLSTVALFFDHDNDGDPDCFLGRSHATSRFLENENGVFRDVTREVFGGEGPRLVESASAADIDADGLLDLYVSTYAGLILSMERARPERPRDMLFDRQLRPEEARRYHQLERESENSTRDRAGPPNRLYHNTGGVFLELRSSALAVYRNTYQATFSDFDGDGDMDLYVANDFAPNHMFRNDGELVFVDVTAQSNAADIGFGMGASFGDYDHDGDFDLYVSNMFSKAGRRITASISSLDPRFGLMARGNSLLALENGRYERVSSLDASGMQVEMSGWAWGALFVDADLDTWPDIYSLAGMYTAPAPFESDVDL